MFLGFAVILWLARGAGPSPLRDAIAFGVAAMFAGIAATGVSAWAAGIAAPLILAAAVAELAIAAGFLWTRAR
jgi:hypothetical protein